ncbi:hypothetical protein MKX03_020632 [Papaver bracteatum]|nr:hypothetical protein MKX03_020632 [Papaver bracteatum]
MENQTGNDFKRSELSRLTTVNWQSEHHRRSITASLVQGVYVLESDRQINWQGLEALAPPWWESFNFKLLYILIDDDDSSIFGAVYQYLPQSNNFYPVGAPRYVIAFRGTMLNDHNIIHDAKLDIKILKKKLHGTCRFKKAMRAVKSMVSMKGSSNIWKNIAKTGNFLESYLFNPTFVAPPTEIIKSRRVKRSIHLASSLFTATLTVAMKDSEERQQSKDLFTYLSIWVPNLFLNPSDMICSGYIGYFENREKMQSYGVGRIEGLATKSSLKGLFANAIGKEYCPEELHLIPSACVTTSHSPFRQAHTLSQWFTHNLVSDPKVYCYEG